MNALMPQIVALIERALDKPAQSLDAQAGLRPFADWPLADLQASTRALDLSALSASAPVTSLSGTATVQTEALDEAALARTGHTREAEPDGLSAVRQRPRQL